MLFYCLPMPKSEDLALLIYMQYANEYRRINSSGFAQHASSYCVVLLRYVWIIIKERVFDLNQVSLDIFWTDTKIYSAILDQFLDVH